MVFSSNVFLFFFLPASLALYYICPRRHRNLMLLAVSLVFYAWGEPVYVVLMLFTIALNYAAGLRIDHERRSGGDARPALGLCVAADLLLLGFFKYAGFAVRTLNRLLPAALSLPVPDLPLPIGISFYIFQSMSYVIDLYRRQTEVQKDIVRFGAYIAMFPQLIAGPIVRYRDVALQLDQRRESVGQFASGTRLFIIGLAKKMLLANRMGALFAALDTGGCLSAWVGMLAYTMQIYFDFSGYSDMAVGLGRMLGFEFLQNFDYPYISRSVTEFWKRWHISLSTWFREYVYIPLGGNRLGRGRQLLNIFIVWALTGLWHGASWNFVLWGLYYGVLLALEKLFLLRWLERLPGAVRSVLLLLTVAFGWMLFCHTDTAGLFSFVERLFSFRRDDVYALNTILAYLPLLIISALGCTPLPARLYHRLDGKPVQALLRGLGLAAGLALCVASLASQSYNPFIYFRF